MEIVMQWLDDVDDLVYAFALTSERTRRALLGAGLLASLISAAAVAETVGMPAWVPMPLAALALASVALWSAGVAAAFASEDLERVPAA
jgi:hypothetical protein